jgi:diguanylate cyclase (GGDEF)-like protein
MIALRIALRLLVLVALAGATCAAGGAAAQVALASHPDHIDLWPQVRTLADPARTLTVEAALAAPERFAIPRGAYATLGMDKEVVWMRIPVKVQAGGEGTWILELDYALLRRVDVFWTSGGKVARAVKLGDSLPFAERPLRGRSHAAPFDFAAGESGELLLRIDTSGGKIVPVSLARLPAYNARALGEQLLQGALAGLGLFLLLYALSQWYHLREALYLKYALLVLASVIFSLHLFGIGEMYLWTDVKWLQYRMAGIASLLASVATALFVEEALGEDLQPWLRKGLYAVATVQLATAFAYASDLIDIQTVAIFMSTVGLAPALMGLPGAIARARRGDSVGPWFILAWLGYFVASAVLVGVVRGRIGVNFWTMHSFQIGATLDMLIFMRIAALRTAARHAEARQAAQERDRLRTLADSDPLTSLLNRRGLDDALARALARAGPDRLAALYILDLDGFKAVNDQYGHDVGDSLLRIAAQRLRGSVRTRDGVARLGGDEFVVVASGLATEEHGRELGSKLVEAFREPFALERQTCKVSATIGYALAPTDAQDAQELMKAADAAMYAGKEQGKDRLVRAAKPVTTPRT